jgi:hypothetical protein
VSSNSLRQVGSALGVCDPGRGVRAGDTDRHFRRRQHGCSTAAFTSGLLVFGLALAAVWLILPREHRVVAGALGTESIS